MMKQIRRQRYPFERMTREPEHNFFGYYDVQPWSGNGRFHLVHRVGFMDRMPAETDRSEIGMIRLCDNGFIPLASTYAWNFQQGAMLQWDPRAPDERILFNTRHSNTFRCAIRNISTGEQRTLSRPLTNLSADGAWGLSINFSRMFDFRPGYGYAGKPDPFAALPAPEDDGIWRMNMQSGQASLIVPLSVLSARFAERFGEPHRGAKLLINHVTFNPSADRFLFLARTMPMPGKPEGGWMTLFATADRNGENMHVFKGYGGASHYCWQDDRHILIYADLSGRGEMALCRVLDMSDEVEIMDPGFFAFDGHCSFSPDRRYLLYDSYPDSEGYRKLLVYDLHRKEGLLLAELLSSKAEDLPTGDIRCDLHPRWSRDGATISFDSTHEGHRHVYRMDFLSTIGTSKVGENLNP